MNDAIANMSADELFRLAEQREQEERALRQERIKDEVQALKARLKQIDKDYRGRMRQLEAEQKQERAGVEAQLEALTGKPANDARKRVDGISAKIMEVIRAHGEISTGDIRARLQDAGIKSKNFSQTMAYLKQRGQVIAVSHGVYRAA
jgi:aspartokinase